MARKWLTGSVFLLVLLVFFWIWRKGKTSVPAAAKLQNSILQAKEPIWAAPDSNSIPANDTGQLIRYGKKLISSTARYFGPGGSMGHNSNGMNCQNCHLDAGTRAWAGNFGSVASL